MKIKEIIELDNNLRVSVKLDRVRGLKQNKVVRIPLEEGGDILLKVLSVDKKNNTIVAKKFKPAVYAWTTPSYRKSDIFKVGIVVWQGVQKRILQTDTTGVLENITLVEIFELDIPTPDLAFVIEKEIHDTCNLVRKDREAVRGDWAKEIRPVILSVIEKHKAKLETDQDVPSQRYYQKMCSAEAEVYFSNNDKGWMQWTCGTGKSFQGYWLYRDLRKVKAFGENPSGVVVLLVPSRHLDQQTSDDWGVIAGSSGQPIRVRKVVSGDSSDPSVLRTEEDILHFIQESTPDCISLIACTYQSSQKIFGALRMTNIRPDLVIYDEAHRITGEMTKSWFKCLLDTNLPSKKKIFMTASPIFYTPESTGFSGMNNESLFGKCFHQYQFLDAVFDGYITPLEVLGMAATNTTVDEIKKALKENGKIIPEGLYLEKEGGEFEGYTTFFLQLHNTLVALKEKKITHPIIYANTIRRVELFIEYLKELAPQYGVKIDYAEVFTGNDSIKSRISKLNGPFSRAKIGVVGNSRCLQEGISINKVDSIVLIDPRFSGPDIIQILGRPVRICKGKKKATVILPVLCEYDQDGRLKIDRNYFSVTRNWMVSISSSDSDFGNMVLEAEEDSFYFNELTRSGISLKNILPPSDHVKRRNATGANRKNTNDKPQFQTPRIEWKEMISSLNMVSIVDTSKGANERKRTKEGKELLRLSRVYSYCMKYLNNIESYLERKSSKLVSNSSRFIKTEEEHFSDYSQSYNISLSKAKEELTSFGQFKELAAKTIELKKMNIKITLDEIEL
jgi:superfamily II DNA or RNA helicase